MGVSGLSVEDFVSKCREFSQGNPSVLCFRKFPLAKIFKEKKGWGVYDDIPSKRFRLTVPKTFLWKIFSVS